MQIPSFCDEGCEPLLTNIRRIAGLANIAVGRPNVDDVLETAHRV